MALVYVTRKIPEVGLNMLKMAGHDVVVSEKDGALSRMELETAVSEKPYDALLTLLSDQVDAELLKKAPNVKIVSNYAVGYNNINIDDMKEKGVVVTNTPDVLNDSVAEFTIALMMSVAKRIPEADRFTRLGKYEGWGPELLLGADLKGKTLGVVGAGRIGASVAEMAQKGFGMHIEYYDIQPCESLEAAIQCTFTEKLEDMLPRADFVTIHVPLLEATKHLMNLERLGMMKNTAFLINTSRGPVVDEAALVLTLQAGKLAGAGLDVFEFEPKITEELKTMDNVVITPHIASASKETRNNMAILAAQAIIDQLEGMNPEHIVN